MEEMEIIETLRDNYDFFCDNQQNSKFCDNVTRPGTRKEILSKERRCFRCFKKNHVLANITTIIILTWVLRRIIILLDR